MTGKIIREMVRFFGADAKRIGRAPRTMFP
jgi:hypothetical protein